MVFNPNSHITKIKGKDYLEVKWRIAWMRDQNPTWGIDTIPMQVGGVLVVKAIITNDDGRQMASGLATVREAASNRESWSGREFEKAETAALGRALAVAGYGTQFTNDFDEGDYLSDSPVNPRSSSPSPKQGNSTPDTTHSDANDGDKRDVHIIARETKATKKGKPMLVFTAITGEKIFLFSRELFKEKGYCAGGDWTAIGDKGTMKMDCRIKMVDGYWEFIPDTVPQFDPDWDELGRMNKNDPDDIPL
jgi:hypothetical protein